MFTPRPLSLCINEALHRLVNYGHNIPVKRWQGKDVDMEFIEVINHSFSALVPSALPLLQESIKPNLPWADEHFEERVSGIPHNPPPSHIRWPFAQQGNAAHTKQGKFDHTYPERFWPNSSRAGKRMRRREGIRYEWGDLLDVVNLLAHSPDTRQAFIPIWYPEDTGALQGQRVPCTIGYHMYRHADWLHCVYYIRSCDALRHFRDDIYMACRLMLWVIIQCREHGKLWKDVVPGTLTMHITSFHAFANDRGLLQRQVHNA